jgi:hypothetical protein
VLNSFYGPKLIQKSFYVFFRMGLPPQSAREMNVDMIEKMLRDKVSRKTIHEITVWYR